ncbi:MAG TPA: hypothetical protein VMF69_11165, partial [Gemmataceae bacterium]|nr:hypothetical protein [Gemmataceae bacterium]
LELPVHPLDEPEQAESEEAVDEPPPPEEEPPSPPPMARLKVMRPVSPTVSYMVVETASPRPLPPASGFEPRPSALTPRLAPIPPSTETPISLRKSIETPVPPKQISETPVPLPVKEPGEGEMWVPLRSTWQPSAQTWPPLAESWHQANAGTPTVAAPSPSTDLRPAPMPQLVDVRPAAPEVRRAEPDMPPSTTEEEPISPALAPTPAAAEPQLSLSAEDVPVAAPWPLLPLVWFNQGFDASLAPLGAPSRWLCGRGRNLLGIIGFVCLAAAIALAVSMGMGWTW